MPAGVEGPQSRRQARASFEHSSASQIQDLELGAAVRPDDARSGRREGADVSTMHWVDSLPAGPNDMGAVLEPSSRSQNSFRLVVESRSSILTDWAPEGGALGSLYEDLNWVRKESSDAEGRPWGSRVYPSAGGTHCIRFLIYTASVSGWNDGWCRWNSELNAAEPTHLEDGAEVIRLVTNSVRRPKIQAALVAVADLRLLNQRYQNGTSLAWRDAGAALAVASLLAADLGLCSTISGASIGLSADLLRPVYVLGALVVSGKEPDEL